MIDQIFEPFFTKKQMGRSGSGLGLSVVWNCVKDHRGYIEVKNRVEKGTIFELYFPVTREATENTGDPFDLENLMGNNESILVVDDIKEQRKIARDALDILNYQPITVASGEKAILFFKNFDVDLMLFDMKMEPGIDGLETYRQVLKIKPGQKAVIASGYSESRRVKKALRLGAGQYIKKLALALKNELDPELTT